MNCGKQCLDGRVRRTSCWAQSGLLLQIGIALKLRIFNGKNIHRTMHSIENIILLSLWVGVSLCPLFWVLFCCLVLVTQPQLNQAIKRPNVNHRYLSQQVACLCSTYCFFSPHPSSLPTTIVRQANCGADASQQWIIDLPATHILPPCTVDTPLKVTNLQALAPWRSWRIRLHLGIQDIAQCSYGGAVDGAVSPHAVAAHHYNQEHSDIDFCW